MKGRVLGAEQLLRSIVMLDASATIDDVFDDATQPPSRDAIDRALANTDPESPTYVPRTAPGFELLAPDAFARGDAHTVLARACTKSEFVEAPMFYEYFAAAVRDGRVVCRQQKHFATMLTAAARANCGALVNALCDRFLANYQLTAGDLHEALVESIAPQWQPLTSTSAMAAIVRAHFDRHGELSTYVLLACARLCATDSPLHFAWMLEHTRLSIEFNRDRWTLSAPTISSSVLRLYACGVVCGAARSIRHVLADARLRSMIEREQGDLMTSTISWFVEYTDRNIDVFFDRRQYRPIERFDSLMAHYQHFAMSEQDLALVADKFIRHIPFGRIMTVDYDTLGADKSDALCRVFARRANHHNLIIARHPRNIDKLFRYQRVYTSWLKALVDDICSHTNVRAIIVEASRHETISTDQRRSLLTITAERLDANDNEFAVPAPDVAQRTLEFLLRHSHQRSGASMRWARQLLVVERWPVVDRDALIRAFIGDDADGDAFNVLRALIDDRRA